jgi:hypothetical protein
MMAVRFSKGDGRNLMGAEPSTVVVSRLPNATIHGMPPTYKHIIQSPSIRISIDNIAIVYIHLKLVL